MLPSDRTGKHPRLNVGFAPSPSRARHERARYDGRFARPLEPMRDLTVSHAGERPGLPALLFGVLCATTFGFAVGAVWMVPQMMFGRALPALVLPAGWVLGVVVRRWLRFQGLAGGLLAAGATLLAAAYTACLVAAATIAGMMGMGLADTLSDARPGHADRAGAPGPGARRLPPRGRRRAAGGAGCLAAGRSPRRRTS